MEADSFFQIVSDLNKYEYWRKLTQDFDFTRLDFDQYPEWSFWWEKLTLTPLSIIDRYYIDANTLLGKRFFEY